MKTRSILLFLLLLSFAVYFTACENDDNDPDPGMGNGHNIASADKATIDRFSPEAGMLMVRDGSNGLPEAGEAIDFDAGEPFITLGLGPNGQLVEYYNFDIQPVEPAPIYVLRHENGNMVEDQLNIIDVIPGDDGYNDFWQVVMVTVSNDYEANTVASLEEIQDAGYDMEETNTLVNCPVVPEGSTASKRLNGGDASLTMGWYKEELVFYFNFTEKALSTTSSGEVPVSPIYVTFNINPDEDGGGPASGFVTEGNGSQTHNVIATLPSDAGYSPLWSVNPYDNEEFGLVNNLASASSATIFAMGVALVNCPVVSIEESDNTPADITTAERASVDRFSEAAGTLMIRDETNGLPEADTPIDFDTGEPFITRGLGPNGEVVEYYNFDVQPVVPAPIYVLFRDGETDPVEGQFNIVDVVPGDEGYNDFWHVHKVTVPSNYVANTVTSFEEIENKKFPIEDMEAIVNCPIVPEGSTASKRLNDADASLTSGWYNDQAVFYFNFTEKSLSRTSEGEVPLSPIYVTFNINPDEDGGGPASGFVTEDMSVQTHNVVATLPDDGTYSPLWSVNVYDNMDFSTVMDFATATSATILGMDVATVNCPVVAIE